MNHLKARQNARPPADRPTSLSNSLQPAKKKVRRQSHCGAKASPACSVAGERWPVNGGRDRCRFGARSVPEPRGAGHAWRIRTREGTKTSRDATNCTTGPNFAIKGTARGAADAPPCRSTAPAAPGRSSTARCCPARPYPADSGCASWPGCATAGNRPATNLLIKHTFRPS